MTRIPVCRPTSTPSLEASVCEALRTGWWGYGPKCKELEQIWSEQFGGWSLATSSCTSALYIAGRLLRPVPGDNVIVPAITYASTASAFLTAGFEVKCVDVEPESLLLEPSKLFRVITSRTRAIVAVHLYGQRTALSAIRQYCDPRGIVLIEDCAHRLFVPGETPVGHMACFSFNAVKEAPAGEGGMLWADDVGYHALALTVSNVSLDVDTLQRSASPVHGDQAFSEDPGLKLRLNDIAACLVLQQLPLVADRRRARKNIFDRYAAALSPYGELIKLLPRMDDDSFLMCVVRCRRDLRSHLRERLANAGVATSVHYPSLSHYPLVSRGPGMTAATNAETEILTLPCFAGMDDEDIGFVSRSLEDACERIG